MQEGTVSQNTDWGGDWTEVKLGILQRYLDAYTTALKNRPFKLIYIDAFAGTGTISLRTKDDTYTKIIDGSAQRAVGIANRPFDHLIFIDKDAKACENLRNIKQRHLNRNIEIVQTDANRFLQDLTLPEWSRGVLFIDPFATALEWSTLIKIAEMEKLDTWILFPTMAVQRVLKGEYYEGEFPANFSKTLNRVYGNEDWMSLYNPSPQRPLFPEIPTTMYREKGTKALLNLYKKKLRAKFGRRFLSKTRTLRNRQDRELFELLFCVGHPAGIGPAKQIAKHLLDHF